MGHQKQPKVTVSTQEFQVKKTPMIASTKGSEGSHLVTSQ